MSELGQILGGAYRKSSATKKKSSTTNKMSAREKKKGVLKKKHKGGELDLSNILGSIANASTSSNIDKMAGIDTLIPIDGDRGGTRGGTRGGALRGARGGYELSMESEGGSRGCARGGTRGGVRGGTRGGVRGGENDMYQQAVLGGFYEMLESFQDKAKPEKVVGGEKRKKKGGFYEMLENMEEFANVAKGGLRKP